MNNLRKAAQAALGALEETTALCVNYEAVEEKDGYEFTEARTVIPMGDAAIAELRAELGLPSVGQVVNEIQAERLSIERACGLGDRIAPCPFCGSENVELICSGSAWFVECRECQATGPMLVDGEDRDSIRAVELWAIPPRTRHPLSGKSESIANQTKDVPPL